MGNDERVRELTRLNALSKEHYDIASLHVAAGLGNIEEVKKNIAAGVNINEIYKTFDQTVLMSAASSKRLPTTFKALLELGAKPNIQNSKGDTALSYAVMFGGGTGKIKELIAYGADVNAGNRSGATPLMLAARFNAGEEVIKTLISAGADVNAADKSQMTALNYARNRKTAKLLKQYGAKASNNIPLQLYFKIAAILLVLLICAVRFFIK